MHCTWGAFKIFTPHSPFGSRCTGLRPFTYYREGEGDGEGGMWYISYVCTGDRIVSGIVFHNCFNTVTARITFTSILYLQCMCIIYIIYTHLIVMRVGNWRCLQTAVYVHVYKVCSGFPPHVSLLSLISLSLCRFTRARIWRTKWRGYKPCCLTIRMTGRTELPRYVE